MSDIESLCNDLQAILAKLKEVEQGVVDYIEQLEQDDGPNEDPLGKSIESAAAILEKEGANVFHDE